MLEVATVCAGSPHVGIQGLQKNSWRLSGSTRPSWARSGGSGILERFNSYTVIQRSKAPFATSASRSTTLLRSPRRSASIALLLAFDSRRYSATRKTFSHRTVRSLQLGSSVERTAASIASFWINLGPHCINPHHRLRGVILPSAPQKSQPTQFTSTIGQTQHQLRDSQFRWLQNMHA